MSRVCKPVRMTAVLSKQGGTSCPYPAMPLESCQSWLSVGATIGGTAVLEVSDALTWQAHVLSTNCSGVTGVLMIVTIRELCLPAGLQQGTEDTGHVVNLSRSNHGQSGSNLDCTIITLPARGPRIVLSPWHRRVRRDGQWSLAERKRDCDVSSATHPASSAPAAVTDLMFLQVPAYPEVFRDGLHTFKLNEQDTDVRAALPAPSDTMCSSCCPPHPRSPLWGFSFIPSLSWWRFIHLTHLLSSGPQQCSTCFLLLLQLFLLDLAPPHPHLSLCFMLPYQSCGSLSTAVGSA